MKRINAILVLTFGVIFSSGVFLSCSPSGKKLEDKSPTSLQVDLVKYSTSSGHQITLKEAVAYIANFLQKSKLRTAQKNYGIGGTIGYGSWYSLDMSKSVEKFNANIPVVNFFPCLNSSGLYISVTKGVVLDTTNCGCEIIDDAIIYTSSGVLKYPSDDVGEEDVLSYLKNMEEPMPTSYGTAPKTDVEAHSASFLDTYKLTNVRLNTAFCGYFEEKDLELLKHQVDPDLGAFDCDAFRYFIGYDPEGGDNKLRIILMGVKIDSTTHRGKNILQYQNGSDAFMMEKAWPPNDCKDKSALDSIITKN